MKKVVIFMALIAVVSCRSTVEISMTDSEKNLINESPAEMRILTINDEKDLAVLRSSSTDFNEADMNSPEYALLEQKLIKTLEGTERGVGLAAPQVGINRRVVAVMRLDKEGMPIEVYANIVIEDMRGEKEAGDEGCLSVPDQMGSVMRYQDITIRYMVKDNEKKGQFKEVSEVITGRTAVIFQHEVDHLNGVLYIDKKL